MADCTPSVSAAAATFGAATRDSMYVAGDRGAGTAGGLARRIGRTIPLVYGSSGVGAVAARWWKSCVNLNAKSPAFAAELPALAYDELAGWGQGGDITRQTTTLVLLRHAGEDASVDAVFGAVRDATEEVMADIVEVWAEGDDDLGRFFDLALAGELVALELAAREGVDPGPVPAVDEAHVHQALTAEDLSPSRTAGRGRRRWSLVCGDGRVTPGVTPGGGATTPRPPTAPGRGARAASSLGPFVQEPGR